MDTSVSGSRDASWFWELHIVLMGANEFLFFGKLM